MTIGKLTVRSIAAGSRPTAAQCSRRIASRAATSSTCPDVFQASPERATVRSVFFGPEPPMRIGRWAWTGRGRIAASCSVVGRPSWSTVSPSSSRRMSPTASSSRSRRSPNPAPKSIPNASCSRSNQAPPMPRTARPSLMWSRVVASLAVRPGLRNVFAPTISPSRTVDVSAAQAARVEPALEDRLAPRALDRQEVIPRPERVPAGAPPPRARRPRKRGQSVACDQSWAPNRGASQVDHHAVEPEAEGHPLLALEPIADQVARPRRARRRGSAGPSRRCRPGRSAGRPRRRDRAADLDVAIAVLDA